MAVVGVVAIGRNEGERLTRCLASVVGRAAVVVYVDSGSTDASVATAQALGADVVALDLSVPFTAARARNAGFAKLQQLVPDVEFVQFVDGDCEVDAAWLATAVYALTADSQLAVVCGRRRERFPRQSVFNRLCDLEWDTPVGEAAACGGDAMFRVAAFAAVGGFDPTLIAGEEPELCVRLRERGGKVVRLPNEMTLHDAAMTRWQQWWRRSVRAGHAFAEGADRHGSSPARHWVREVRSNWLWGLAIPTVAVLLAPATHGWSLGLLAGFVVLAYRVWRHGRRRAWPAADARAYALFTVLGKFPQTVGQIQYHLNRLAGRRSRLIEYKGGSA